MNIFSGDKTFVNVENSGFEHRQERGATSLMTIVTEVPLQDTAAATAVELLPRNVLPCGPLAATGVLKLQLLGETPVQLLEHNSDRVVCPPAPSLHDASFAFAS